jgi:hypothetical protein
VQVLDADGVSALELVDLGRRLPIYLYWSPDGRHLAVLAQHEGRLQLSTVRPDQLGHETLLADGSPLFFTWAGSDRLAAFVGSGQPSAGAIPGRVALIDPRHLAPTVVLPGTPGNFCAPVWLGDRLLYVAHQLGRTAVVAGRQGSAELDEIEVVDGLVALVPSRDGRFVARAIAPDGDGTPYRRLAIIDVATGNVTPLLDQTCLAFLWTPDATALLVARVDTARNLLQWLRVGLDGRVEPLVDMYPTRDLGFYLRFFEQYSQSHHLVDPTGRYLLLAGGLEGQSDAHDRPRIWRVSLERGHVEELAEGVFAVYAP